MKIDAHQHFWQYSPEEYDWIGDSEKVLKHDFLPSDLSPILNENNIDGCVAVQARQTNQETQWLIELSKKSNIIKAVVGWIDLRSNNLTEQLKQYKDTAILKGFRHVLQGEHSDFMLAPEFINGLKTLEEEGYTYDLLVFAHQLPQTIELVSKFKKLNFVVDHIAKPAILANEGFSQWKEAMFSLAKSPNVYCKVSGMVTEADIHNWKAEDFTQYLEVVFNAFGVKRIMFGSDWPVCLLAGEYAQIKKIIEDFVLVNYPDNFEDVFGKNALAFYQIT
ncbi:amidohydrolase family protein [Pseudocolwellia agarivorans]|uniref:amidohydrolase family protein n=1 Tax=Pseudocolwellia agarivorans TaxID=1911682 RepID=UPI000986187F|nr:amidohydrolase family protein [Pseudocolwellia agarivorans]